MGDVVGSIVGSAVEVLLQTLISLCKEEISLIRDFKKDLERLEKSLRMIQAFLNDVEKQQVTREAVKLWLKNLEAVAFDAENVLDELNYEVLRMKIETGNKMKKKVQSLFSTRKLAGKIKDINENLKLINQEATDFGLQRHVSPPSYPCVGFDKVADRETDSYSDSIVFGRDDNVSGIVNLLTSRNTTHDEKAAFSVIPIVGMGGLGKTTLARLVFNHEKIEAHFEKRIWVYVSENFDAKDLFKKILESLADQRVDLETKDPLLRKIQQILEAKRYLLVLDDVWIEDRKKWGDFLDTLSSVSSGKGSGILVTTRSGGVASVVGTVHNPELSKLPDEYCWSIIKENAFRKGCIVPSEFEVIGKQIARRCQGLPLAAKVVAGLLHGKSKEEWCTIERTRLSNLGGDGNTVTKILKLSFDNLPSQSLKKCFAFCSIFPKGFHIQSWMLRNFWMSQGFLQSDQRNDMEVVASEYVNILLQNSLLQFVNPTTVTMHDLVRDLAHSTLVETGPARYIFTNPIMRISKEEARNVRLLIFAGKVCDDTLSNFKHLRGLVLVGNDNKYLPKIDHLIQLRYLDIHETSIECLPKSIGNLYHLQTLRANSELEELPKTLNRLRNLRDLCFVKPIRPHKLKAIKNEEISMLLQLQHLKSLYLHDLPNLRSICFSLAEIHVSGVGKGTAIVFPDLKRLQLSSMSSMTELITAGEIHLAREVVAFPHLEFLELVQCRKLTSAPSHLPCLKEFTISGMEASSVLDNLLENLTSLTKLRINAVEGLICLPEKFFCNNQNLSYFHIGYCPNLTHLASRFGASLREIEIFHCSNLEELPEDLHCLNSLARLRIEGCPKLKSIPYNSSKEGFTSLRDLRIIGCSGLTELPIRMLESCALSLEAVCLYHLTSLTNMAVAVDCLQKMPHLYFLELDFKSIPELANNDFPLEIGSFRSLRRLSITSSMDNWDRVQDQLQHLTDLRYLRLINLEIEAVPEWLGKLPSLCQLHLEICPKLTSLPSKEAMNRITKLWIWRCPLLNLRRDVDDSEWHKISHIPNIYVQPDQFADKTRAASGGINRNDVSEWIMGSSMNTPSRKLNCWA